VPHRPDGRNPVVRFRRVAVALDKRRERRHCLPTVMTTALTRVHPGRTRPAAACAFLFIVVISILPL